MSAAYTVAVIGGGLVGLATARALRQRHRVSIVVLEAAPGLGAHQSGRNSGVVHSGLYYRPGSLKARLCIAGRELLYDFCREHGLRHERCGKLLVAVEPRARERLRELEQRAQENGLQGVRWLEGRALVEREPHVGGGAGLLVPQTGIVDFVEVARTLAAELERDGVEVRLGARVRRVARRGDRFVLGCASGEVLAQNLLGCAGLEADRVARLCGATPPLTLVPFRGDYYRLAPERTHLVRSLIYPAPQLGLPFLGVHLTRTVHGRVEAGPNAVLALSRRGYDWWRLTPRDLLSLLGARGFWRMVARQWSSRQGELGACCSKRAFVSAVQQLVPAIRAGDLSRARAGVRAHAVARDGTPLDDFQTLQGRNMLHVLHAPSPAATACLSLGQELAQQASHLFELGRRNAAPPSSRG